MSNPLFASSFRPPAARVSSVRRHRVIALLADPDAPPVTALIAPPGYGKTTVLAAWAAHEARPVAWLTLTDLDNDPVRLLTCIIAAYAHAGPLSGDLTGPLPTGADRLLGDPLPRLLAQLSAWKVPAILVLDDIHRIEDQGALDIVSVLLDRLPEGFRVALAGRSTPQLPLARLRAHRDLLEIGVRHLALDGQETEELARRAGVALAPQEASDLAARTEGWAAGIYLAILGTAENGERLTVGNVSGADHYIADYLRSEVRRGLSDDDVTFLTRTSVLDLVTPGSSFAVTGLERPGERLERLAAANLLISRVDGVPDAYRYHTTLREYVRAELDRREPGAASTLHSQAAAYFAAAGDHEAAISHAFAGQDPRAAARYLAAGVVPMYQAGKGNQLMRWLEQVPAQTLESEAMLPILGAWLCLLEGRAERAEALADIAERTDPASLGDEGPMVRASRRVLRGVMGRNGLQAAVRDARTAMTDPATPRQWWAASGILLGLAHLADPEVDVAAAEHVLARTLDGTPPEAAEVHMSAHALHALVRLHVGDLDGAAACAARARDVLATTNEVAAVTSLVVLAADARIRAVRGDIAGARETLVRAQLVRPRASYASPWQSVPPLLDLARAYLALSDPGGAQTVIRQAEDIVRKRPGMGGYGDQLIDLRRKLQDASNVLAGSSTLTTAELRVLPLLPTYLSFEEIGKRLNVSRNTVKTHAMSIYGKLWASSRGEAVERAVELGLLEPYPVLVRRGGEVELGNVPRDAGEAGFASPGEPAA